MAKGFFDMVNTFSNTRDPGGSSLYKNKGKTSKVRTKTSTLLTAAKKTTTGAGGSSEG